jgi:hypothetical protein
MRAAREEIMLLYERNRANDIELTMTDAQPGAAAIHRGRVVPALGTGRAEVR